MPEYSVAVLFEGQGSIKVRANSEAEAIEDARQMDLEDIDVALFSVRVVSVHERDCMAQVRATHTVGSVKDEEVS